jgi:hypothetical protein
MEFPTDVLGIIREFSKPCMRFSKEFNEAMRKFETIPPSTKTKIADDVKEKLKTKDAEKVINAFIAFVDANVATRKAQVTMESVTFREEPERWLGYVNIIMSNMERREKLTRELFILLYGVYDTGSDSETEEDE